MVFGRWTEDGEDERNATTDGLGAVERSGSGEEELFGAISGLPGSHRRTVEVNGHGISGRQVGGQDIVGEVDGGLR